MDRKELQEKVKESAREYKFGWEAMQPILAALGLDTKKGAFQRIVIDLAVDGFPVVLLQMAPNRELFESEGALHAIAGARLVWETGQRPALEWDETIRRIVRTELAAIFEREKRL